MSIIHQVPSVTVGPYPVNYGNPDNWTFIEGWDTNNIGPDNNEMPSIFTAFNDVPRGAGACWNPQKTLLTLSSSSDDTIRTFALSTPNDPDTATLIATRAAVNPGHLYMNASGTQLMTLVIVGDLIRNYPCNNFTISALDVSSDVHKGEFGYNGSGDGTYYPTRNFESIIWDGNQIGLGNRSRRGIFSPAGNFDSFSLGPLETIPYTRNAAIGGSKISNDGLSFYRGNGNIEWMQMTDPYDISTVSFTSHTITWGFPSDYVIVDPDNFTEVWIVGDNSSGLQLARMATNAPPP